MNTLCFYHRNCLDGLAAAYAVKLARPRATFLAVNYQDRLRSGLTAFKDEVDLSDVHEVIIVDFSFPMDIWAYLLSLEIHLVLLDHHKSVFDELVGRWSPTEIYECSAQFGDYRRHIKLQSDAAGCVLAWEYFVGTPLPAIYRHIDAMDRRIPERTINDRAVTRALKLRLRDIMDMRGALEVGATSLVETGCAICEEEDMRVAQLAKFKVPCVINLDDDDVVEGWAVNGPAFLATELATKMAEADKFGLVWSIAEDGSVICSFRGIDSYNVERIAKHFGGGGHLMAAGCSIERDTFFKMLRFK